MYLLAIESATSVCSAALLGDGKVLIEKSDLAPKRHSEILLSFVAEVLYETGISSKNLDAVAVSSGPGSFTGLRIGLGIAKGIAVGRNIPVIPVPTTTAIAFNVYEKKESSDNVSVILPARNGEYYWARYERNTETPKVVNNVGIYKTKDLFEKLTRFGKDIIGGEGIVALSDELRGEDSLEYESLTTRLSAGIQEGLARLSASSVGLLAAYFEPSNPDFIEPAYSG